MIHNPIKYRDIIHEKCTFLSYILKLFTHIELVLHYILQYMETLKVFLRDYQ
jgi:hypothetical protein